MNKEQYILWDQYLKYAYAHCYGLCINQVKWMSAVCFTHALCTYIFREARSYATLLFCQWLQAGNKCWMIFRMIMGFSNWMFFSVSSNNIYKSFLFQKNRDVLDPNCQHKRTDYGLPEGKFLFGCFNQLYKMDPEIFTTW